MPFNFVTIIKNKFQHLYLLIEYYAYYYYKDQTHSIKSFEFVATKNRQFQDSGLYLLSILVT